MEQNKNQRLFGMIGFAMRARKLILGTPLVCAEMRYGKIKLVVISKSASEATKNKLKYKCEYYKIPAVEVDIDMQTLSKFLGKSSVIAAVGVTDERFAEEIMKAVADC